MNEPAASCGTSADLVLMNGRAIFLGLLIGILPCLGFAQEEPKPVLRWGSDAQGGAPHVFYDPTDLTKALGFEVDLIAAMAEHMGREPVFIDNDWDGLMPGLDRGLYDIAIDGIPYTPELDDAFLLSEPYTLTSSQLVVHKDNTTIQSLEDCKGKAVGTLRGSMAERILRSNPDIDMRIYTEEVNAYADLFYGRIDATLLDTPIVMYYGRLNKQLKPVGPEVGTVKYVIAMHKTDLALQTEINKALEIVKENGQLREILERWNLWSPQMADYLDDHTPSTIEPTDYYYFLKTHQLNPSILERLNRYLSFMPILSRAALTTMEISVLAMALAITLGLLLALAKLYGPKPLHWVTTLYIEVMRGTPVLIQLFFIFYGLPHLGINLDPIVAGILGLGLNYAAFEAENYRAGLLSVPKGQMEAARALGMSHNQALKHVIIPQAFRLVLPPVTNDFISLIKDSSLVSLITIVELTRAYTELATTYYDYFGIGILVALIYLLLGLPFVYLSRMAERRLALENRKPIAH